MNELFGRYKELAKDINDTYEQGVTLEQAERLAAKFLHAQIEITDLLAQKDLDARMRKSGLKAVKAAVYLSGVQAVEKKPSDVLLQAKVDVDEVVCREQDALDQAEVFRDQLQNYFDIFRDAHIYYRGIAKGAFNG